MDAIVGDGLEVRRRLAVGFDVAPVERRARLRGGDFGRTRGCEEKNREGNENRREEEDKGHKSQIEQIKSWSYNLGQTYLVEASPFSFELLILEARA